MSHCKVMKAIREEAYESFRTKLDAIIVQDLGVLKTRNEILDSAWSLIHEVSGNAMQASVLQTFKPTP